MRKCCCCIGLRAGCIIIGLLFLIMDVAVVAWGALGITEHIEPLPDSFVSRLSLDNEQINIILYVAIGLGAMSALCDLLLLDGAARHKRCSMLFWLIWTGLVLFLATVGLLVVLALCVWILVDETASDRIGWHPDDTASLFESVLFSEDQRKMVRDNTVPATLIAAGVGLLVTSILWGWYSAVDAYYRRLKHSDVIVKTQYVHSSRL